MDTATETPRVWIGCLAAYNAGHLHGEWVDATDADELHEAGKKIISTSPADYPEELFLADNEGFGGLIGEYTPFATVAELGRLIEEHGRGFILYAQNDPSRLEDLDGLERDYEEARVGEGYDSMKDYAYEYVDGTGGWAGCYPIPEELEPYLDWDMIARDLEQSYWIQDGFVFRADV